MHVNSRILHIQQQNNCARDSAMPQRRTKNCHFSMLPRAKIEIVWPNLTQIIENLVCTVSTSFQLFQLNLNRIQIDFCLFYCCLFRSSQAENWTGLLLDDNVLNDLVADFIHVHIKIYIYFNVTGMAADDMVAEPGGW